MTLVDVMTEGRIVAALLVEPAVLADARELEVEDFTDPRLRAVFSAIRNLQAKAMLVDALEVDAEIARLDELRGTTVADKAGLVFIADLMLATVPYNHSVLWDHDIWWLRELSRRRRSEIHKAEWAS